MHGEEWLIGRLCGDGADGLLICNDWICGMASYFRNGLEKYGVQNLHCLGPFYDE